MLTNKRKGFTLIEVVIVLAIAALIMVVVFLAVAGAQRSQRDQATNSAVGRIIALYSTAQGDLAGATMTQTIFDPYINTIMDGNRRTPVAWSSTLTVATGTTQGATMIYRVGGICSGTAGATAAGVNGNIAVSYWSESKNGAVCKDNQ